MSNIYSIKPCVGTRRIACAVVCAAMSLAGAAAAETEAQNNNKKNSTANREAREHRYAADTDKPVTAKLEKENKEYSHPDSKYTQNAVYAKLCDEVSEELRRVRNPRQTNDLYIESIELGGRYWRYLGVDLDGDGEADGLTEGCGSPSDGNCQLEVQLSTGGNYDFEEETFSLIRFRMRYYIIVGDGYPPEKFGRRRLYILSKTPPVLVCNNF